MNPSSRPPAATVPGSNVVTVTGPTDDPATAEATAVSEPLLCGVAEDDSGAAMAPADGVSDETAAGALETTASFVTELSFFRSAGTGAGLRLGVPGASRAPSNHACLTDGADPATGPSVPEADR